MAQLLLESEISAVQREGLNIIEQSCASIVPILDRIYYYLELENGELTTKPEQFSLKHLVFDIIRRHMPTAREKNVKLTFNYDESVPTQVIGVSYLAGEVLNTLINNAVRFTQKGKIDITVSALTYQKNQFQLEFIVSDTGPGIPEESRKHLFDLFDLDIHSAETAFVQAGLNLSIAKKIVDILGGDIQVKSKIGHGSLFKMHLPFESIGDRKPFVEPNLENIETGYHDVKSPVVRNAIKKSEAIPKTFFRVLIIEDNLMNLFVIKNILKTKYNCDITTAMTFADAMERITKDYDLILTDINLPDGKGINIVKKVNANKGKKAPPIVAMTAHATEEECEFLTNEGVVDIAIKPITLSMIKEIIKFYVFHIDE